jgi:hypothetical protein
LCDAEELPVSRVSLTVGGTGSVPRKKSLTWQQTTTLSEPTVPCSKEQQHSKQQVASCSEQSEDEVTAETSLLPHQVEQPAEEKVSTFSNQIEIVIITLLETCLRFHSVITCARDTTGLSFKVSTSVYLSEGLTIC